MITGIPTTPVGPGAKVNLTCRSAGTSREVLLIWYKNGRVLDRTFATVGRNIENRYEYVATLDDSTALECRLEYQPLNLRASAFGIVPVLGQ